MKRLFPAIILTACCLLRSVSGSTNAVLVVDNFSQGIGQWTNQDTGRLEWADAPGGGKCLKWTASDDGIGYIGFRDLTNSPIRFSEYDLLTFRVKVEGKPLWNINPIIQQYPAVYGFRGLYYSVDTLDPFGEWFQYTQDLRRWENAWKDGYSTNNQEFAFEIYPLAGNGKTTVYLADITLLKNALGVKPSYPGVWRKLANGAQATEFMIELKNTGSNTLAVTATRAPVSGVTNVLDLEIKPPELCLAAGVTGSIAVRASATPDVLKGLTPWYGEIFRLAVRVKEQPGLVLYTDLAAGTRPEKAVHPSILCAPEKMRSLQQQYADPAARAKLARTFLNAVTAGEKALKHKSEYPPMAFAGRTTDPITGGKLVKIAVPNLPFDVYQDPISGRSYSGHMYDAGLQGWTAKHMANAAAAEQLGMAYLVSGRKEFAEAAAAILKKYADCYLDMPICAPEQGSPVGSRTSGSCRIGSTFMRERVWLAQFALAMDSIIPSGVLGEADIRRITERVLQPSADNMMDHKIGAMNLQWMIQAASLFAGLAGEAPSLVTRAVHDGHGMVRLMEVGFCKDGNWWENPSYQQVALLAAYPALSAAIHNGIMPWSHRMETILKAPYVMYGPDGKGPILGTGGEADYGCANAGVAMFSKFIKDPELAYAAYNMRKYASYGLAEFAVFRYDDPGVPRDKAPSPIPTHTTFMPDYGGVALRVPGTDRYCYFHYGRDVVHGHRNKLSINAYGGGGWFVRNVAGGYGDNFKNFLETSASASSIMVDGGNADTDTGELLYYASTNGVELACGRELGAWKNVEHERAVALTRGPLIVLDRCVSETEHTYDWLHHPHGGKLELVKPADLEPRTEPLGATPRYESLIPEGTFKSFNRIGWTRKDGSALDQAFAPGGNMYLVKVNATYAPHNSLVWRKRGKTVGFAMAFLPYAQGAAHALAIEPVKVTDALGKTVDVEQAQAVRVRAAPDEWLVLANYSGELMTAEALSTTNRLAVAERVGGAGREL